LLGHVVVVKLLPERLAGRMDLFDRIRLEAQALGCVSHPNVVSIFDLGALDDGRPFLVIERLTGRTLKDELAARGTVAALDAVALAVQALAGLSAIHRAGIIHRDVKLDNLFVCDPKGRQRPLLKLLDLGAAKVVTPKSIRGAPRPLMLPTGDDVSVGTPRFFSPEQSAGLPLDARTDVYSMGLVLYTLVAGRGPFDHLRTVSEILAAHVDLAPEPPSEVARMRVLPDLEAVILTALAKKPQERYPSAAAFAQALRTVTRSERGSLALQRHEADAPTMSRWSARVTSSSSGVFVIIAWMILAASVVALLWIVLR
jgi:serine/threonine-protein kinase